MNKTLKLLTAGSLILASGIASAHPGHDHTSWLSDPIHLFTALAIGASVAVMVWLKSTRKQAQTISINDNANVSTTTKKD